MYFPDDFQFGQFIEDITDRFENIAAERTRADADMVLIQRRLDELPEQKQKQRARLLNEYHKLRAKRERLTQRGDHLIRWMDENRELVFAYRTAADAISEMEVG